MKSSCTRWRPPLMRVWNVKRHHHDSVDKRFSSLKNSRELFRRVLYSPIFLSRVCVSIAWLCRLMLTEIEDELPSSDQKEEIFEWNCGNSAVGRHVYSRLIGIPGAMNSVFQQSLSLWHYLIGNSVARERTRSFFPCWGVDANEQSLSSGDGLDLNWLPSEIAQLKMGSSDSSENDTFIPRVNCLYWIGRLPRLVLQLSSGGRRIHRTDSVLRSYLLVRARLRPTYSNRWTFCVDCSRGRLRSCDRRMSWAVR